MPNLSTKPQENQVHIDKDINTMVEKSYIVIRKKVSRLLCRKTTSAFGRVDVCSVLHHNILFYAVHKSPEFRLDYRTRHHLERTALTLKQ